MSTKKKVAAIVITTVALTAGTVVISSASSKATKASLTRVITSRTNSGANMMQGHGAEVASVLAGLVANHTITQAQSDAITAALAATEATEHANAQQPRMAGPGFAGPASTLSLISSTIGIDTPTIKSRLAAGETLGAIAGAKKDLLITALIADETKRIDAAVTAGKLTPAQAATLKSTLTTHVTNEVNSTRPVGPMGGFGGERGRGGRGHGGGPAFGGPAGAPAMTLPSTPTA